MHAVAYRKRLVVAGGALLTGLWLLGVNEHISITQYLRLADLEISVRAGEGGHPTDDAAGAPERGGLPSSSENSSIALIGGQFANPTTNYALRRDGERGVAKDGCLDAALIHSARIVAAGVIAGTDPTGFRLAGEAKPVGRVAVQANNRGAPLILVMAAGEPVIWDFTDFPIARLRAVIIAGDSRGGVARLPANIPIRFASTGDAMSKCGRMGFARATAGDVANLEDATRRALGVAPYAFTGGLGESFLGVDGGGNRQLPPPLQAAEVRSQAQLWQ